MTAIRLQGISHEYDGTPVLDDIHLEVPAGELCVLVGPSGCGKSTLLRILAGLIEPTRGDVLVDGTRVNAWSPKRRDVAMVFQNYALYPHMSVRRNLGFPLRMRRMSRREIAPRVEETARILGIQELLDRRPTTLSGGQMQRVALGRAIIRNPRLFLFDEPLSNLDAKLRNEMRGEIARLHEQMPITTVYVTHDQAEAMTMGSLIAVMNEGRLEQVGSPLEVFERPETAFTASFIGSPPMNLLEGTAEGGTFTCGALLVPGAPDREEPLLLGIRPHDVAPGTDHEAPIGYVERLGSQTILDCDLGPRKLRVTREGDHAFQAGDTLSFALPRDALHWFDARTGHRLPRTAP